MKFKKLFYIIYITLLLTAGCSQNSTDSDSRGPIEIPGAPSGNDVISASTNQSGKENETAPKLNGYSGAAFIQAPQISNYGAVSLNYVIEVPDGRSGMEPEVGLSYSSSSGDGLCGIGWNLSTGLDVISRTTDYGPLFYDSRDTFKYKGKRLIKVSGSTENENGTYRLEIESGFSKFVLTEIQTGGVWHIYDKAGDITVLGEAYESRIYHPEDSSKTYTWNFTRSYDLNGNYMEAVYDRDDYAKDNIIYLKEIRYTGNYDAGVKPRQFVRFLYRKREDKYVSKAAGFIITMERLLERIEVGFDDDELWHYELVYQDYDGITRKFDSHREKLVRIESDRYSTAPEFEYQAVDHQFTRKEYDNPLYNNIKNIDPEKAQSFEGDFDGNGISDTLYFNGESGNLYVVLRNSTGVMAHRNWGTFTGFNDPSELMFLKNNVTGDFDGNGKSDVAFFNKNTGVFWVALSTGENFNFKNYGKLIYDVDIFTCQWFSGDYDSNGLSDTLLFDEPTGRWILMKNMGDHFQFQVVSSAFKNLFRGDFVSSNSSPSGTELTSDTSVEGEASRKVHFVSGDFTGNGSTDICIYDERDGRWWIGEHNLNQDGTFTLKWKLYKEMNHSEKELLANETRLFGQDQFCGDFNGDGFSDFIIFDRNDNKWILAETGINTMNFVVYGKVPDAVGNITRFFQGDFNGDGRTDIGMYSEDSQSIWFAVAEPGSFRYYKGLPVDTWPEDGRMLKTPLLKDEVEAGKSTAVILKNETINSLTYVYDKNPKKGEMIFPGFYGSDPSEEEAQPEILIFNKRDKKFYLGTTASEENVKPVDELNGQGIDLSLAGLKILNNGKPVKHRGKDAIAYYVKDEDITGSSVKSFNVIYKDTTGFVNEEIAILDSNLDAFEIEKSVYQTGDFDEDGTLDVIILNDNIETPEFLLYNTKENPVKLTIVSDDITFDKSIFSNLSSSNNYKFFCGSFTTTKPQILMTDLRENEHKWAVADIDADNLKINFKKLTGTVNLETTGFTGEYKAVNNALVYVTRNNKNIKFIKLKVTQTSISEEAVKEIDTVTEKSLFYGNYDKEANPLLSGIGGVKRVNLKAAGSTVEDAVSVKQAIERKDLYLSEDYIKYQWIQGDFNGDSKTDIGFFNINAPKWYFCETVNNVPDMLIKVHNGIGGTYQMTYANSSTFDNTGEDNIPDLPMNYKVCTELTVNDGIVKLYGDESKHSITTKYDYKNGFAFSAFTNGRKETDYFGFSEFTITDANGTKNVTIYNTTPYDDFRKNRALAGAIKESYTEYKTPGGLRKVFNRKEYNYKIHEILSSEISGDTGNKKSYLIEPVEVISRQLNETTGIMELFKTEKSNIVLTPGKYEMVSKTSSVVDHYQDDVHAPQTLNSYSEFKNIEETNEMRLYLSRELAGSDEEVCTQNSYDERGNLTKQVIYAPNSKVATASKELRFQYDVYGNLVKKIDASDSPNRVSETEYDELKQYVVLERVKSSTVTLETSYKIDYAKAFGQVTEKIDANGNSTYFDYDDLGKLVKQYTDTDKGKSLLAAYYYNQFKPNTYRDNLFLSAKVVQYTGTGDADIATRVFVDGLGRVIQSVSTADNGKFVRSGKLVYDSLGRVIEKNQADWAEEGIDSFKYNFETKHPTKMVYDNLGRTTKVTLPLAEGETKAAETFYYYDTPWQNRVYHSVGRGKLTVANGRGQVLYVTDYGKGEDGKELSASISFVYDLAGRRVKKMDGASGTATVTCLNDSLFAPGKKDTSGANICQWKYDGFGQLVESSDADLGYGRSQYNGFGDVTVYTDAQNRKTMFVYDDLGRLIVKNLPGDEGSVVYGYDSFNGSENALGKVVSIIDRTETKIFSYDRVGRTKSETRILNSTSEEFVTEFTFDLLDRTSTVTYPESPTTKERLTAFYSYNPMGVKSLYYKLDGNITQVVKGNSYNEFGQVEKTLYGNNLTTNYQYDIKGRLMHLETVCKLNNEIKKIQDVTYKFNIDNSVKNIENRPTLTSDGNVNNTTRYEYTYDGLNRLISAKGTHESITTGNDSRNSFHRGYNYSNNGNFTGKVMYNQQGEETDRWTYSYTNHSVNKIYSTKLRKDRFKMEYDASGNMTAHVDKEKGLSKRMEYDSNNRIVKVINGINSQNLGEYSYDDQGFRVKKVTYEGGTVKEVIHPSMYYGFDRQQVDTETGEKQYQDYHEANNLYINGVRLAVVDQEGRVQYYHTDQVDSVKVVTNQYGMPVTNTEFLPYGETWFQTGDKVNGPKYNSQELDKESGFYYYNARHYDAEIGRFVTADSVIPYQYETQSWNRYSYCRNNPVLYKDPTGHADIYDVQKEADNLGNDFSAKAGENLNDLIKQAKSCPAAGPDILKASEYMLNAGTAVGFKLGAFFLPADESEAHLMYAMGMGGAIGKTGKFLDKTVSKVVSFIKKPSSQKVIKKAVELSSKVNLNNFARKAGGKIVKGVKKSLKAVKNTEQAAKALNDDIVRITKSNIKNSGVTVLGPYNPEIVRYVTKAERKGANYFSLGDKWDDVIAAGDDPWKYNELFLDIVAKKKDKILLSVPKAEIRSGSYLQQEIDYLTGSKGYIWKNQWSLQKRKK